MFQGRRAGDMHIWTAEVAKADLVAYFDKNKESEVIVPNVQTVELFQRGLGKIPGLASEPGKKLSIDWITSTIAIGDRLDSQQLPPEFDSVLNVAIEVPVMHEITCLHLPIEDNKAIPFELLDRARHFLSEADRLGHKVFVHCRVGASRSPAIVAMWLAIKNNVDFHTALEWIQAKRAGVDPADEVVESVKAYLAQRSVTA